MGAQTLSPMKWSVVPTAWKLPKTHPLYVETKTLNEESKYSEQDEDNLMSNRSKSRNSYSMWSSAWSANIIGTGYLRESGQSVAEAVYKGLGRKLFGDAE